MIYVTTSRKPSQATRRLAKWLALLFGGESENRGKRGVGEVVERASRKGFLRVLFIYEAKGNPSKLVFFDEEKGWLEPEIIIVGANIPVVKGARLPGRARMVAVDKGGKVVEELLGSKAIEEGEDFVEVKASAREIFFEYGGKRVGPVLKTRVGRGMGAKVN